MFYILKYIDIKFVKNIYGNIRKYHFIKCNFAL